MAHVITNDCTGCASCEYECPSDAISVACGKFEINSSLCNDCGVCAFQCPVEAIKPE